MHKLWVTSNLRIKYTAKYSRRDDDKTFYHARQHTLVGYVQRDTEDLVLPFQSVYLSVYLCDQCM